MKLSVLSIGLLAAVTPLVSAWTKEDSEIFRLRDEIATYEGPTMTFYDFLGVPPTASQDDINRAYRKKSRSLHPDKAKQQLAAERTKARKAKKGGKPGTHVTRAPSAAEVRAAVKAASDRQARLSIVANILRGAGRERYDHFLANGFPVWKGTGYYYSRYRPGLGTVVAGLFLFAGGGAHYLALYMSWKRQREFVGRYIKFARHAAWGENLGIPGVDAAPAPAPQIPAEDEGRPQAPLNRKQRRMQERETKREARDEGRPVRRARRAGATAAGSGTATPTPAASGPTGAKKRVVAENGKVLVVDSLGDVYLEQEDEDGNVEEFLLDPNEIPCPTIKDTAVYRLPIWVYKLSVGRLLADKTEDGAEDTSEAEEAAPGHDFKEVAGADTDDSEEPGKRTPSTTGSDGFELLDKSVEDLSGNGGKATGSQPQQKQGKSGKRKGKKR
ncbi:Endoplasmic reticulum domain-containing protein [Pleurostoma richardsiae]|uniref:Endoplasmic reticulum domain-containing protein n=1 Tax=Pleurostoma richardsiae TaxID=41990 RepID=A0AA38R8G2_9PEZI|nr:Endoplasmic reticulum domain-containing protein [Pleurostoma richardsiae]